MMTLSQTVDRLKYFEIHVPDSPVKLMMPDGSLVDLDHTQIVMIEDSNEIVIGYNLDNEERNER